MKTITTNIILLFLSISTFAQINAASILNKHQTIKWITPNGTDDLTIQTQNEVIWFNTATNTETVLINNLSGFTSRPKFNGNKGVCGNFSKTYLVNGNSIDSIPSTIYLEYTNAEPNFVFNGNEAYFVGFNVNTSKKELFRTDFTNAGTLPMGYEYGWNNLYMFNNALYAIVVTSTAPATYGLLKYQNGVGVFIDSLASEMYVKNNELFYFTKDGLGNSLLKKMSSNGTISTITNSLTYSSNIGIFGMVDNNSNMITATSFGGIFRVNSTGDSLLNSFSLIPNTIYPTIEVYQNYDLETLNGKTLIYTAMRDTAYFINNQILNNLNDFGYIKANGEFKKWNKSILPFYARACDDKLFYIHLDNADTFRLYVYDPITNTHTKSQEYMIVSIVDQLVGKSYQERSTVNVINGNLYFSMDSVLYQSNLCGTLQPTAIHNYIKSNESIFYPNPATTEIYFKKEVENILITDISGQCILEQKGSTKKLNTQKLKSGLYFVIYECDGKYFRNKLHIK